MRFGEFLDVYKRQGVVEVIEEAAGWIVLPVKGRSYAFQIYPNHAAFGVIVLSLIHIYLSQLVAWET